MSMKLFVISRRNYLGYDTYRGHVIAAPSSTRVRQMAADKSADEGREVWLDAKETYCTCISDQSKYQTPIIVLSDFNAG
jgi:hypothetical protein